MRARFMNRKVDMTFVSRVSKRTMDDVDKITSEERK